MNNLIDFVVKTADSSYFGSVMFIVYYSCLFFLAVPPPQTYQDLRRDSLGRARISTVPGAAWRA